LSMITNAIDPNRVTHQGEIRSPSWLNAYRLNQQTNKHMEKVGSLFFLCLLCPPPPYNLLSCCLRCCTILDASMFVWTRPRIQSAWGGGGGFPSSDDLCKYSAYKRTSFPSLTKLEGKGSFRIPVWWSSILSGRRLVPTLLKAENIRLPRLAFSSSLTIGKTVDCQDSWDRHSIRFRSHANGRLGQCSQSCPTL
jgi:hypothetical protein